jgi:hypothetical protein
MTSEDSYMIRTYIMVYLEDDADVIFTLDWGDADGILGSLDNIRLLKRIPKSSKFEAGHILGSKLQAPDSIQ